MQTKKLIEAFRGIGLRTKMGFDGMSSILLIY